jgi:hypothetical protein
MAAVDIDVIDAVVNHRTMSSSTGRSRGQRNSAPSTRCQRSSTPSARYSGIVRAGSIVRASNIGWDVDGDTGTVECFSVMGESRCGACQGSHAQGEDGCGLHDEKTQSCVKIDWIEISKVRSVALGLCPLYRAICTARILRRLAVSLRL